MLHACLGALQNDKIVGKSDLRDKRESKILPGFAILRGLVRNGSLLSHRVPRASNSNAERQGTRGNVFRMQEITGGWLQDGC